jgi:hypothetical protein
MPDNLDEPVRSSFEYPSTAEDRSFFLSSYSVRKASDVQCVREPSAIPVQNSEQSSERFLKVLPFLSVSFGVSGEMRRTLDSSWADPPCRKREKSFLIYHIVVHEIK